jgi:hypothetical protein
MKKLLVWGLSLILMLSMATVSWALSISTSGEIDSEYMSRHWTGESVGYTLIEVGLYNTIEINDNTTAYLNFWYESDQTQVQNYNVLDDAYITYKFGNGNMFLVGKTRYWQLQGHFDSLSGFFRGALGSDDILEPPVSVIGKFSINDNFTVTAGYFFNTANKTIQDSASSPGTYSDDKGYNIPFLRGEFTKGNWLVSAEVLQLDKAYCEATGWAWLDDKPATDYMVDVAYNFGRFSIWAAYLGVAQSLDNNKITNRTGVRTGDIDKTDQFCFIGATASIGKFWITAEYAVSAPDSYCPISSGTGSSWSKTTDWSEDAPFGFDISYYLGNNTTLKWTYATNTGNWQDKNRIRLIVKF